jgi:tetratricopeptide (TPR) repeat protein
MSTNRIDQLLEFHAEDRDDPFLRFALASEYLKIGDEGSALDWFEKLVAECPNYVGTYYHLGKLYVRLGRPEDALKTFDHGIAVALETRDAHAASELRSAKMEIEIDN